MVCIGWVEGFAYAPGAPGAAKLPPKILVLPGGFVPPGVPNKPVGGVVAAGAPNIPPEDGAPVAAVCGLGVIGLPNKPVVI